MTEKTIFISSADSNYFPLLLEWVHSILSFKEAKQYDIGILDAGLTENQCQQLEDIGCLVKKAEWPCPLPDHKIRGRNYLKSCVCRPFIPNYFPDHDTYFWMDADTWIQRWESIDLFLQGAKTGKITLTAQVDRAYPRQVRLKWLGNLPIKLRGFYYSNAMKAYGAKTAKALYPYHVLLAGAFALERTAPHWKRWQELMVHALQKGKIFTAEQLSLGVLCYLENYPKEILPAWTHWLCEFKPLWNTSKNAFVEPYIPHNPIGILHLSGWDEMRLDRSLTTDFETLDGNKIERSYRYQDFDGETGASTISSAA